MNLLLVIGLSLSVLYGQTSCNPVPPELRGPRGVYSYVDNFGNIATLNYNSDPVNGYILVKDPVSGVAVDLPNVNLFN